MTREDIELTACNVLNQYLFDKVWNESEKESRREITLDLIYEKSSTGSLYVRNKSISLPTQRTPYVCYAVTKTAFGVLDIPNDTWQSATEILKDENILLNFYSGTGKVLPKDFCYIMNDTHSVYMYIAIHKGMMNKLLGMYYDKNDIHLYTYYYHYNYTKPSLISFKIPKSSSEKLTLFSQANVIKDTSTNTQIFINGAFSEVTSFNNLLTGDYVEVFADNEIIGQFDINVTNTEESPVFYSEMDSLEKYIIHIPLTLNDTKSVLTSNTINFMIFATPEEGDEVSNGRMIIHDQNLCGIKNITFNDFSIPEYIIEAYEDMLQSSDLTIRVFIRKHNNDNVVIPDGNFVNLLYSEQHTDEDIINHLRGSISTDLSFWKAQQLEQTEYVKMLTDVPNIISSENIEKYVKALGYYHTISVICDRMYRTTITDGFNGMMVVEKPIFLQDKKVLPLLYHNGEFVSFENYSYEDYGGTRYSVTFASGYEFEVGDDIIIETYQKGKSDFYEFEPSVDSNTIDITLTDFEIYRKYDIDALEDVKGIETSFTETYEKVTDYSGLISVTQTETGSTVLFGPMTYGFKYLVQPKICTLVYQRDVDYEVTNIENIHVTFTKSLPDMTTTPIHSIKDARVILNNKVLIKGIDYDIYDIKDSDSKIAARELVVNNLSYIKESGNKLVVILHSETTEDISNGFIKTSEIDTDDPTTIWYDNISSLTIEGKMVKDVTVLGDGYSISEDDFRVGAPYELKTVVPSEIKEYIDEYYDQTDSERLRLIHTYFNGLVEGTNDVIFLEYSHDISSTVLTKVLHDLANGTANIGYDPDDQLQLLALSEYDYLRDYDLTLINTPNLSYVDIYPSSINVGLTPNDLKLLNRIKDLLFGIDPVTDGEMPDE